MTVVYNGNYSMGGAFGSEYLGVGIKRLYRSDNVSSGETLSAAMWEATSAQKNCLQREKRALEYGNMKDCLRSGRPAFRTLNCAAFAASTEKAPQKSVRKSASLAELCSTIFDHKRGLTVKTFLPMMVNLLSHADNSVCFVFGMIPTTVPGLEVQFSAESAIYCSSLYRNVFFFFFFAKTFPRHTKLTCKTIHPLPLVVMWRGVTSIHVTGSQIFTNSQGCLYFDMWKNYVITEPSNRRILKDVV
jgi:hypothetical protein